MTACMLMTSCWEQAHLLQPMRALLAQLLRQEPHVRAHSLHDNVARLGRTGLRAALQSLRPLVCLCTVLHDLLCEGLGPGLASSLQHRRRRGDDGAQACCGCPVNLGHEHNTASPSLSL